MLLDNDSLSLLRKRANVNYNSEQAMAELLVSAENSNFSVKFRLRHIIPSSLMKQQIFQSLRSLCYVFNTWERVVRLV